MELGFGRKVKTQGLPLASVVELRVYASVVGGWFLWRRFFPTLPESAQHGTGPAVPSSPLATATARKPRRNVPIPRDLTNYNYGVVGWSNGQ
jgi:hypothetical protein